MLVTSEEAKAVGLLVAELTDSYEIPSAVAEVVACYY